MISGLSPKANAKDVQDFFSQHESLVFHLTYAGQKLSSMLCHALKCLQKMAAYLVQFQRYFLEQIIMIYST